MDYDSDDDDDEVNESKVDDDNGLQPLYIPKSNFVRKKQSGVVGSSKSAMAAFYSIIYKIRIAENVIYNSGISS